jgi:ABC-2 type transport system ATP-binding protein
MADPVVTDRLTKYYGDNRVVNGLSFRIPEGSVYALLGRNGAGKTTTIRMLLGLVQPDFGTARLLGEEPLTMSRETREKIAWVGEGHPLYRWMSVRDAMRFAKPFYTTWNQDLVDRVLDHFKLPLKKRLFRLSNGQRAQVSLALAVAPEPQLMILDDPTIGLDTVVRRDFLESMIQIIQQEGRTILFSSHILSDVDRVADRIGIIVDGVLRVDCSSEHFRNSVRRIVVELSEPVPSEPAFPSLAAWRQSGTRLELVVVGGVEARREYVESLLPVNYEELELGLEDAFVEYTRGSLGDVSVFTREPVHV